MQWSEKSVPGKTSWREKRAGHEAPFRVLIHNDDFTPMDFVVHILVAVFLLPIINAEQVMYSAHLNGTAYVQTLPEVEAQRRIGKACFAARLRRFPLRFSMEAE